MNESSFIIQQVRRYTAVTQSQNRYKADLRELRFVLFEQFARRAARQATLRRLGQGRGRDGPRRGLRASPARSSDRSTPSATAPAARSRTARCEHAARLQGRVEASSSRPGWKSFAMPPEHGGRRTRTRSRSILQELQSGANTAFNMYPGLTHGAADVIEHFALPEDKERFLPHMLCGPLRRHHVPVRAARRLRRRRHQDPGEADRRHVYAISGTKCWISAGDHDLAENIVHLVLARIDGAPAGTKGLSLFIVPKIWVNDDGSARRAQRRRHRLDRAQARHQGVGHRGAQLRRERRLPRHPGGRAAAPGHQADVPHDEQRAHRASACRAWRSRRRPT